MVLMFNSDDNSHLTDYQLELFLMRKEMQEKVDDSLLKNPRRKMPKKKARPNSAWVMSEMRTEDGAVTALGWERIESLTRTILRKHFPSISIYKDLIQIGVIKAAQVVMEDPENGVYRSLRTYIYTCIRNEISNYLYHTHKRTRETSDGLMFCKTSFKHSSIDNKYIDMVFNRLPKKYNRYKEFITSVIAVLSDSEDEYDDETLFNEIKLRSTEQNLELTDEELRESFVDFILPVEKQIITLIVNAILVDQRS